MLLFLCFGVLQCTIMKRKIELIELRLKFNHNMCYKLMHISSQLTAESKLFFKDNDT